MTGCVGRLDAWFTCSGRAADGMTARTGKRWWTIHWQSPRDGRAAYSRRRYNGLYRRRRRRRAAARSDSISTALSLRRGRITANSLSALFQRREKRKSWCAQLTPSACTQLQWRQNRVWRLQTIFGRRTDRTWFGCSSSAFMFPVCRRHDNRFTD